MVGEKLKNIIYKQLNKDLGHAEIIPFNESIFFIDRGNKYWYFELTETGLLWWRYEYFTSFFSIFSLEKEEFEKILACWVEEIMNCMVNLVLHKSWNPADTVEEVLNCKVSTTSSSSSDSVRWVEEVLNCKVSETAHHSVILKNSVQEVLNYNISSTKGHGHDFVQEIMVEEALNYKVSNTDKVSTK